MAHLSIQLLGPMWVILDGQEVTHFETEKVKALLAYLTTESDRPQRRDSLAEMLWPERPQGAARANLRHALASLRRAIHDSSAALGADLQPSSSLLVTRESIQFNRASETWVDVAALKAIVRSPYPSLESLEEAARLCRGLFLADLSVTDSAAFSEWLLVTREQLGRYALGVLHQLAARYERLGQWERSLECGWRQVELDPCDEPARRQLIRLLALTGQRSAALAQYRTCCAVLADELGVEPEPETTELWQRIRDGELAMPSWTRQSQPAHQAPGAVPGHGEDDTSPVFVAREREMAQLCGFLDQADDGTSRVVFVSGGAGQGKTALMGEFARRALDAHTDLLVAWGDCSAYAGAGDPYLPFRDLLAMLTGDVEARRPVGWIGRNGARRLWSALPITVPALLANGPSLIGTFLGGNSLLTRVTNALPGRADWLAQIRTLTQARAGGVALEQSFLFDQVTAVLCAVARDHPLLIVIDDVHWADSASVGLLFHLGRRLAGAGSRILVVCAYRPEELFLGQAGERHPLEKVLHELKRTFGDVWVDLDSPDPEAGRGFIDALLDTEPNRLGDGFRDALYHRTGGHPLFTIELLRAMQERGDLIHDPEACGVWIVAPTLDWNTLPARVEAVIQERTARLDPQLLDVLTVASVVGETFTAQVVAAVQDRAERSVLQALGRLETLYHLVRVQSETHDNGRWVVRYQFSHILVQAYIYGRLSEGERKYLHRQVAEALLSTHEGQESQVAVQLAYHYRCADDRDRALHYSILAAASAARTYAHQAAVVLYAQAIDLANRASPEACLLAGLHRERGLAYEVLGEFENARADFEMSLELGRASGERLVEWRALVDLAELWALRDYGRSRIIIDEALALARHMGDPAALASSLNRVGNWLLNAEELPAAIEYHRQALALIEQLGDREALAHTLDDLGLASQMVCDTTTSIGYYDRAIAVFRELGDLPGLVSSLTGRGIAAGGTAMGPTQAQPILPTEAHHDLEEALRIAREIDLPAAEAWALWCLSLYHMGRGQFGSALEAVRSSLDVASAIGHREWTAGAHAILGGLYVELLAPEIAEPQLRQALDLASTLQSRHWIHYATAVLAATCCLLGDLEQARTLLEGALSPDTPMDTIHRRMCWARRAELALLQGDPALALDIAGRLISSAPGITLETAPGRVIPFLWKLKGEALTAMGQTEEACSLLCAAVESAEATGQRSLLWRLHASLGRLYRTMARVGTRRPAEAGAAFSLARQCIGDLANTIPDQRLRDQFVERAYSVLV